MTKWLILRRYEWGTSWHPCEWYDWQSDAVEQIVKGLKTHKDVSYRLAPVIVKDGELQQFDPTGAVAQTATPDDALADGERRFCERAELAERDSV